MFDDEFLISKVDTDFHTTLDSVVKQGERYLSSFDNGIILQSEIENLIHLTNEGLERKKPDLFASVIISIWGTTTKSLQS